MSHYIVYLPYMNMKDDIEDIFGHKPLAWLFKNFKGRFDLTDYLNKKCTCIIFDEKEDMELFILTWGECLWSIDDLPNL